MYLSFVSDLAVFSNPLLVGVWLVAIALLAISNLPTLSWSKLRPRRSIRLEVILVVGLMVAAAITEPWWTLVGICVVYLALIPVGAIAYARVRRRLANRDSEQVDAS